MSLRYRPLLTPRASPPMPFDLWLGPQVDVGWIGHPATLEEQRVVSAGLVAGLEFGLVSGRTKVRMGFASMIGEDTPPVLYLGAVGTIF